MEKRRLLAQLNFCRSLLYYFGMITDSENEKIRNRVSKWQDKNKIEISQKQLDSVDITYKD